MTRALLTVGICFGFVSTSGGGGTTGGGTTGGGSGDTDGGAQPGCSLANCHTMADACRVELAGVSTATCAAYGAPPAGFDYADDCVAVCNEQRLGEALTCVASKAPVCLAASDAGMDVPYSELDTCFDAGVPERQCEANCAMAQRTCNGTCYPLACDLCARSGMTNCSACPDGGFLDCIGCSQACGRHYLRCSAACPRG